MKLSPKKSPYKSLHPNYNPVNQKRGPYNWKDIIFPKLELWLFEQVALDMIPKD